MTSRIGSPDTDADRELRACLDQRPLTSFVMVAGAGSGKTTSLIKALDHLARSQGTELRRRNQRIACITYTEVAVGEISSDVGNASLFHVSTIHSFLWTVIRSFHNDLREWVTERIAEKIAEAEAHIAKSRTRANTRERLTADIARYQAQRTAIAQVNRFSYGTGSDYRNGVLGHSDVLKAGPWLIANRPLLRTLVARRFPVVFVDESQDTDPNFIEALKLIAATVGGGFCLGFFGDPMQKIYATGAGAIVPAAGWNQVTKPENFRCPSAVLNVINRIRAENDGLVQTRGRVAIVDDVAALVEGTARLFALPADTHRSERLAQVRRWLAETNADPLWNSTEQDGDVRVLILVHRMAARRLGFADLFAALNDNGADGLKDGLIDGTAWVLRPLLTYLLPLVLAARAGADFEVISALRRNCPLLSKDRLSGQDAAALLDRIRSNVSRLCEMFSSESTSTLLDVFSFVHNEEIAVLDDRFLRFLPSGVDAGAGAGEEPTGEEPAVNAFLACAATQCWGYRTYIDDESPYATQHGIKGAEFERVLVVLDDEEADYSLFSYGKYFGITPLSDKDQEHEAAGTDSVLDRTRRLFYVCCSRAVKDLAVILFVPSVPDALATVITRGLFDPENVHTFGEAN